MDQGALRSPIACGGRSVVATRQGRGAEPDFLPPDRKRPALASSLQNATSSGDKQHRFSCAAVAIDPADAHATETPCEPLPREFSKWGHSSAKSAKTDRRLERLQVQAR